MHNYTNQKGKNYRLQLFISVMIKKSVTVNAEVKQINATTQVVHITKSTELKIDV